MNDMNTATAAADSATVANGPQPGDTDAAKAWEAAHKLVHGVKRSMTQPENVDASTAQAMEALVAACNTITMPILWGWDFAQEVPEGMGIAVAPLAQKEALRNADGTPRMDNGKPVSGMVTKAIIIGVAPGLDALTASEAGRTYLRDSVEARLLTKLTNSARPALEGSSDYTLPRTTDDYIVTRVAAPDMDGFNKVAPTLLDALGKAGVSLNKDTLKRCLEVSAFAEAVVSNMTSQHWDAVLARGIALARKNGIEPGAMASWVTSRYATVQAAVTDTAALDALLADDSDLTL